MAFSLSLDVKYFLVGSNLFFSGCSAVSCDFDVSMRGGELEFFSSAIVFLSWRVVF